LPKRSEKAKMTSTVTSDEQARLVDNEESSLKTTSPTAATENESSKKEVELSTSAPSPTDPSKPQPNKQRAVAKSNLEITAMKDSRQMDVWPFFF
jgi:hypothetical protein